ncbi:ATP-binding protein [Enterococcus cecorum]
MLVQFAVTNFLSFKERQCLSLETGPYLRKYPNNTFAVTPENYGSDIKLIKNAVVFGANASGKSNLVEALHWMREMILHPKQSINEKLPYYAFRMNQSSMNRPTVFEVELIYQKMLYKYCFSYKEDQICDECFQIYDKKQDDYTVYFERKNGLITIIPSKYQRYSEELRDNLLGLHLLQEKNDQHAIRIMKWFDEQLVLFDRQLMNLELLEDEENKLRLLSFLKLADMNIVDVEPVFDLVDGKAKMSQLYVVYNKYDQDHLLVGKERISYALESVGTQKLITLALHLLFNKQGKVFILDEFDDAFHQELSLSLVQLFNAMEDGSQFILTTHDLQLMDNQLRKDQIYFINKNYRGESRLYSLFDFAEDTKGSRSDITYYRRYLKGLFGGIPNIETQKLIDLAVNRK